ncbi:unnamed protein product [Ranitomeya imitator]|uniref:Optic atrophy 3 protein n=1 Tax=Ranitomeya imitator TaxID=111125 RepID=A0ABN9LSF9_9NEOB|nr:unnamed protein product [Ranitomeya imitator]
MTEYDDKEHIKTSFNAPHDPVCLGSCCLALAAPVYHWVEMRAKMRIMGFRGAAIKPMNEEAAADLGAELLGEATIFLIGGACMVAEYSRQATNSRRKEEEMEARLSSMETEIARLGLLTDELDARARAAERQQVAKLDRVTALQTCSAEAWCRMAQEAPTALVE